MRSRLVSESEIRKMFNEGRYYERMQAGEFQARIVRQIPCRRGDRRIRNTMSQTVEYVDKFGNLVARPSVSQAGWIFGRIRKTGSKGAASRRRVVCPRHGRGLGFARKLVKAERKTQGVVGRQHAFQPLMHLGSDALERKFGWS